MATDGDRGVEPGAPDALAGLEGRSLLVATETMAGGAAVTRETLAAAAGRGRDALLVSTSRPPRPALLEAGVEAVDCTPGESTDPRVHGVNSPDDLTGVSMPFSEFLSEADRPVVALDSLTALLQYTDESTAFRFVSVMATQLARGGGLGLCVFAPDCHDGQTVHVFDQVFDGRTVVTSDGVHIEGIPGAPEAPLPR